MAITVAMRTEVSQLYVALFGRAPDSEGLGFWVTQRNSGQTLTQIANSMFATAPAREFFPTWMTNQEIIGSFYENVLGRTADAEGLAFWTAKLNAAGATPGSVITQMIDVISHYTGTDAAGIQSAALFNNKVHVAQYYAEHGGNIEDATIVLAGVTSDPTSDEAVIAAIDAGTIGVVPDAPQSLFLSVSQDGLVGGTANDTFYADVAQNSLGQQVNTLGSGDHLVGGAGTDTLMAKVTAGVFAGSGGGILGTQTMPIQPSTNGIEVAKFEAVNSQIGVAGADLLPLLGDINDYLGLGLGETNVYINAKDMQGVNTIGSWHSDANLIIQNMTTQDNSGMARVLSDMTVVMGYTGNTDSHWSESDLKVYFDQDYLNPEIVFTRPSVDIRLMNEDKYDVDFAAGLTGNNIQALAGVYIEKLVITVNGVGYSLAQYIGELGAPNSDPKTDYIKTYADLLVAVQSAVAALKAANPNNAALQTLTATDGGQFLSDISPVSGLRRVGESVTLSIEGATNGVANTLVVQAQDLVLDPIQTTTIPNSNRFERAQDTPAVPSTELSINVNLEKVGNAGDGGSLVIGSMFKDGYNEWQDKYEGKGIAIFDVTVSGGSDKPSSLSGMHSTGNNLRTVNVVTDAAQTKTYAALTIGNSNTPYLKEMFPWIAEKGDVITPTWGNQFAMKDVQTFDASGFKGDLTLFAALTGEVTEKYLTLTDGNPDPAPMDNVHFVYTGGTGNDYINLWLDDANYAKDGSPTREDMDLTINGGAGNDEIVTMIGNGYAGQGEDQSVFDNLVNSGWYNWYQNQAINANLTINGDAGNDTVRTLGSGNWTINGGTGDDTIYADNTGMTRGEDGHFNDGRATWVYNAVNNDVNNLLSQNAASVSAVNAQLTVHFMGYEKTVTIANSMGATANVAISDLAINQAIKAAINLDPVLNKLLVAEDGPARTLVVRSLIDGYMDDGRADYGFGTAASYVDNLSVTFSNTALAGPQLVTAGLTLFAPSATGALLDGYGLSGTDHDAPFAYDGNTLTGGDSNNVADNQIQGGTGNDVIVLGTGTWSNDTLVYTGFGNGTDSIVNFQDTWYPAGQPVYSGAPATTEVIKVTFSASDGTPANETIIFDGDTVTLSAPATQGVIPSIDVASQFATQFAGTNWSVTGVSGSTVTLTHNTAGAVTDVTPADFAAGLGTYFGAANGNGTVSIATTTQGADAIVVGGYSTFSVDFDAANTAAFAAGTFVWDGTTVNYAQGDGSLTLANKVGGATYADWNVSVLGDVVTFTAKAPGATAIAADTVFKVDAATAATDGIVGVLAGAVGTANTGTPIVTITPAGPSSNFDFIDFSSYHAAAVVVTDTNQTNDVVYGAVPVAGKYITMTESTAAASDGVYTINLVTSTVAGTADDVVQLIGVADFGFEKDFVAATFVM